MDADGEEAVWRQRLALLGLLRRVGWRWQVSLWALVGLTAAVPAAFAVAVGVLVVRVPAAVADGVGSPAGRDLWLALALVAVLLVVERMVAPALEVVRSRVSRDIDGTLRSDLLAAADGQPHIDPLEDGRVQSLLALVKGGLFGTAGSASVAAAGVVGRYAQSVLALAVVAWLSPLLALVVGAVILAIRRRWHGAFSALADGLLDAADALRRVTYTAELVTTPAAAKEVRVFDLLDWLVDRARGFWVDAVAAPFAVRARLRRSANVELAVLGASYGLTFVLAARATAEGAMSLGLLTAILQAQFSAAQLIAPTTDDFSTGPGMAAVRASRQVEALLAERPAPRDGTRLTASTAAVQEKPAAGTAPTTDSGPTVAMVRTAELDPVADPDPMGTRPPPQVTFDDVSFTYPGATTPLLEAVDLRIDAGESLALVGLNGAGKTTLVKLLCGLYRPRGGRILADDVPLEDVDPTEWRARVGVIFQDFVRYELTAADNVRLAALDAPVDGTALDRAAVAAGADDLVAGLSAGWDTVLSRQYPGGTDLSGGQWQRVALARALFAVQAGAGLLVLDEPTANLDVRAEAEVFDRFLAGTASTTALVISHRFSTVRRADRIAVLDGGRIAETGTHEALLARGGRYAELFLTQAERFRREPAATTTEPASTVGAGSEEVFDA